MTGVLEGLPRLKIQKRGEWRNSPGVAEKVPKIRRIIQHAEGEVTRGRSFLKGKTREGVGGFSSETTQKRNPSAVLAQRRRNVSKALFPSAPSNRCEGPLGTKRGREEGEVAGRMVVGKEEKNTTSFSGGRSR